MSKKESKESQYSLASPFVSLGGGIGARQFMGVLRCSNDSIWHFESNNDVCKMHAKAH